MYILVKVQQVVESEEKVVEVQLRKEEMAVGGEEAEGSRGKEGQVKGKCLLRRSPTECRKHCRLVLARLCDPSLTTSHSEWSASKAERLWLHQQDLRSCDSSEGVCLEFKDEWCQIKCATRLFN